MSMPLHPKINEVPYQVIGRAVVDAHFRAALFGAGSAKAIRQLVQDELDVSLSSAAAAQIEALDPGKVNAALSAINSGSGDPSAQ